MDANEVREYLQNTEEGKALLEEFKQPLINKRDELLAENRRLGEKLSAETQRATDNENLLADERTALHSHVVDGELDRLMDEHGVLPHAKEAVRSSIKSQNTIQLEKADGGKRVPMVANGDEQTSLEDYMASWANTDEAKSYIAADGYIVGGVPTRSSGGGSQSQESGYEQDFRQAMGLD
jgi:hypothetical protein